MPYKFGDLERDLNLEDCPYEKGRNLKLRQKDHSSTTLQLSESCVASEQACTYVPGSFGLSPARGPTGLGFGLRVCQNNVSAS